MTTIQRVSPEESKRLVDEEGYVYVDVRSIPEYEAGHPAGSLNIPSLHATASGMQPNPHFSAVMDALFPKDAKLVLGCRSGQRSLRAAEMLAAAGRTNMVDQRAGFEGPKDPFGAVIEKGWAACGLPTETTTDGGSYAELARKAGVST